MEQTLLHLERAVWGWPLLLLILGTGCWLTVRLRFLPIRRLGTALRLLGRSRSGSGVTPFGAFCTALSSTIGTGNIVGVATALTLGGPGALLWMEVSAVTGMAVKYAEGFLAVRYRRTAPDGTHSGGPATYILLGLGARWRPLAVCFSALGAAAGLCGVGTFVQVGSVMSCFTVWLERAVPAHRVIRVLGRTVPLAVLVLGCLFTVGTALLVFRDLRAISRFSAVLVPVMGGLYLTCCLWILCARAGALPSVLGGILRGAVRPSAAISGGLIGTVRAGVSRGVFSNEAGLGTAPIAAAGAEGVRASEQGLISMTASVFDTLLVCTMTGLVLLVTGSGGLGVRAAQDAFAVGLPFPPSVSRGLIVLCLALFAFTTVVGWSYYAVRCLAFLTGGSRIAERIYLTLYVLAVAAAPFFPVRSVWMAANICNGLMSIPNLLAILLLSPRLALDARDIMKSTHTTQRRPELYGSALS